MNFIRYISKYIDLNILNAKIKMYNCCYMCSKFNVLKKNLIKAANT